MIKIAALLMLVIATFAKHHHHKSPSFLATDTEYDVIPEGEVTYD